MENRTVDDEPDGRLTLNELHQLRKRGTRRTYTKSEILLLEGTDPGPVLILESGLVKVTVSAEAGEELLLGFRGPGELLGEMSALRGCPRSATVTAHAPSSVTEIPEKVFRQFLLEHPNALLRMLLATHDRLRKADQERLLYLSKRVVERVASRLLEWCVRFGKASPEGHVEIRRFSRRELAQSIAASEKTVDEALAALTRDRILRTGRQLFVILDPAALSRTAHPNL
ncbi:Crp/Fnr family transcriptional regulator [Saccharomonospora sp. NB11]|uniref:Crp/Fnr family transcriptional regulator n=1 Tax=Saccharomonospora sp. NB11 TaxID=1642298 RepID=UPI0018D119A5|nr:Crp/Fnr family transcriptional regulator [Saccharomonospora sp. NB11]